MSIASEISRLQGVKADILQAISDKGVTVPAGSALDDCPGLIASISGGGGGGGGVTPILPNTYKELLYGTFTGSFNVGESDDNYLNYNDEIEGEYYMPTRNTPWTGRFYFFRTNTGTPYDSLSRQFEFYQYNSSSRFRATNSSYVSTYTLGNLPTPEIFHFKQNGVNCVINGNSFYTSPGTENNRKITSLASIEGSFDWSFSMSICYLCCRKNGVEIKRFIPVERIADNVRGIYELYSGVFYSGNIA